MENMGKRAKDKITGFEGIIVAKIFYITGCDQCGISPVFTGGKPCETGYFDTGRVEILGDGVDPESVRGEEKGGVNRDAPGKMAH